MDCGCSDEKRHGRTRRCSEREPADSLRDKSNVIDGWLPSLTFALGGYYMSRHLPTLRGWAALMLAVIGTFSYPLMLPPYFVQSGVGDWITAPVPPATWILGGFAVLACFGACFEALRRGSRADKVAACIGFLLSISLLIEYLEPLSVPVRQQPNYPAPRNTGIAPGLATQHHWPGVRDPGRWTVSPCL